MSVKQIQIDNLGIPGILAFDETEHGLLRGTVTSELCTAEFYLHGAHLTRWHPRGHEPILFLSERSEYKPGKAIRGGVPIIFPWFGARTATTYSPRTDGPSHGFARTSEWRLTSATADGAGVVHIKLTLEPNETSRALGYDHFQLDYTLTIGSQLTMQLTVRNNSQGPMIFEEALHSYFLVGDAQQIAIGGLAGGDYFDKTDGFKQKRQNEQALSLVAETDRPYVNTTAPVVVTDPILKRQLSISKENSQTTVVWNPWIELTAKLADMDPDGWRQMVCVEVANAMANSITLAPNEEHTMQAHVAVVENGC